MPKLTNQSGRGKSGFFSIFQSLVGSQRLTDGLTRQKGIQLDSPYVHPIEAAVPVSEQQVYGIPTVYACIRIISDAIGGMTPEVYQVDGEGNRKRLANSSAKRILRKPNRYHSWREFSQLVTASILTRGNSYSLVKRVGDQVVSIMPLCNGQMVVELQDDGSIEYRYTENGVLSVYGEADILHIRSGLGNGIQGISVLAYARNTFGISLAQAKLTSNVFKNGGKRAGILSIEGALTDEQTQTAKKNYTGALTGDGADDRLLVLQGGMTYAPIALSPEEIELLDAMKWSAEQIAQIFGVPSVLLNLGSGTGWGSGISNLLDGFFRLTLAPLAGKIQVAVSELLFPDGDIDVVLDADAFVKADQTQRYKDYEVALRNGILTPGEVRAKEGFKHLPDTDQLYMASNTMPMSAVINNGKQGTQNDPVRIDQ